MASTAAPSRCILCSRPPARQGRGDAFRKAAATKGRPSAIVAHTIKGYPISKVIGDPNHHGKALTEAEAQKALAVIG